jgi:putative acetyltransferase
MDSINLKNRVTVLRREAMLELVQPATPELWSDAQTLIEEYAASLGIDLSFQDFEHERQTLAHEYGPPRGCLLIARYEKISIGCGAYRPLTGLACEMKRLYVVPRMQGRRIGHAIAEALITRARAAGYTAMRLDTLPEMRAAQRLYVSLGFVPANAYRHNPIPGASFWELSL